MRKQFTLGLPKSDSMRGEERSGKESTGIHDHEALFSAYSPPVRLIYSLRQYE
jgi:hypothetical protein